MYGCDSGCCGHTIEIDGERTYNKDGDSCFDFFHPRSNSEEDRLEYAKQHIRDVFGDDHVKDLDWENCDFTDYCQHR